MTIAVGETAACGEVLNGDDDEEMDMEALHQFSSRAGVGVLATARFLRSAGR